MFSLDHNSGEPLVTQIVTRLSQCIASRQLRPGSRAQSIREFSRAHGVSTSTVVEAYDRLVAAGLLTARRGSGFYVEEAGRVELLQGPAKARMNQIAVENDWLLRDVYERHEGAIYAGCGWLPETWHDLDAVSKGLRHLALHSRGLIQYGPPKGYEPLRQQLTRQLAELEIEAPPGQILLTQGASQAIDLIVRRLTQPGDVVFVDDPGYSHLFSMLRTRGLRLVGVPMTATGPSVPALEALLAQHKPQLFITNTQLQNPTGASYSAAAAFQVLRLAERHHFFVVEDNVAAGLVPGRVITLAGADQLKRVIYVGSFSKSIAPGLRLGFVAAEPGILDELVYHKLVAGLSTPVLNERLAHFILMEGHARKQLEQLRNRLAKAQGHTCRRLENARFKLFFEPGAGMFVWARPADETVDTLALSQAAAQQNVLLAPGNLFRPDQAPSPWLRFNVAYCDNDKLFNVIEKAMAAVRTQAQ
jgi:DNA-binding transcriptional MocR family regulator